MERLLAYPITTKGLGTKQSRRVSNHCDVEYHASKYKHTIPVAVELISLNHGLFVAFQQ